MKEIFKKIIAYILQIESRLVIFKYKPKIVAIAGSVGKTSAKDAIYAILSGISHVRKSEKSYNSEIGLPLTILGVPNGWNNPLMWLQNIFKGLWLFLSPLGSHKYPEWLVLEVGVGKPDDMRRTASWLKTDAVIITAIGETPAHIEFFNSRKDLIEEESKLIKTLKKDGLLILNADDDDILQIKKNSKHRTITYGFKEGADVLGSQDSIFYDDLGEPQGITFRIDEKGNSLPVVIEGVFGRNHVYASLGALAFSSILKFNMLDAVNSLKNYDVAPGRMRPLNGINNSLIIDDTYSSSPFACESALKTLVKIKPVSLGDSEKSQGRRIAILGDMLELGKHTEEAHKNIGKMAKENCDVLIVVGPRAQAIKSGAIEAGMNSANIFEFLDSSQAGEFIKTFVQKGSPASYKGGRARDLVLVKGSQGMRMERVVEAILFDKENKKKLLVRQDDEWLKKK